jgi:hypothetical protein
MLPRSLSDTSNRLSPWQELAEGAATIGGLAELCARALVERTADPDPLSLSLSLSIEAQALLAVAAERGVLEIRVHKDGFDSVERFLAVCVEYQPEKRLVFLRKDQPEQTIRFLDGFRQLCQLGLVIHHLQGDFSLSRQGFELAKAIAREELKPSIDFAAEMEL